jgi:hypothetical protein
VVELTRKEELTRNDIIKEELTKDDIINNILIYKWNIN